MLLPISCRRDKNGQQQAQNTGVLRSAQNDDVKQIKPIAEAIVAYFRDRLSEDEAK
jgi:hypothetical protein